MFVPPLALGPVRVGRPGPARLLLSDISALSSGLSLTEVVVDATDRPGQVRRLDQGSNGNRGGRGLAKGGLPEFCLRDRISITDNQLYTQAAKFQSTEVGIHSCFGHRVDGGGVPLVCVDMLLLMHFVLYPRLVLSHHIVIVIYSFYLSPFFYTSNFTFT